MFDPSMEGAEIASWLEKQGNIRVIYDKKYGIFTHHLYTAKYDLIITDLDMPGVRDGDLLKNTSQQTRRIFHICITNCKDLYKVAFAEVHGVRDVLFKPVDFEALEKIIMETICGRKHFLIAAGQARADYIARSVTTLGHFVHFVQKEYELNRIFLEKSIDYVIYDDSFDLSSPDVFFKKLDTFNKNGMRSLALLKKMPDAVLRTTLETHGIEKLLPASTLGEDFRENLIVFLRQQQTREKNREDLLGKQEEKIRLERQRELEEKKEKKEEQARKESEKKAREDAERRGADKGKYSLIMFVKDIERKFYDQQFIEPVKTYLKTRSPQSGEAMFELLNSKQGQPVLMMFSEVFMRADSHFKEIILDIFSEMQNPIVNNTLLMALKDNDPDVRFLALLGLQDKKDDRFKTLVSFRLLDDNAKVRKGAAKILEEDPDIQVVKSMVDSMRKYADDSVAGSLAKIIEKKINISKNISFFINIYPFVPRDVKEIIISEFVKTRSSDIIEFLLREMKSQDDMLSRLAVDGLNNLKDPMALPLMIDYLKTKDAFYLQDAAQNIMESIKSKKYLPLLEKAIIDGTVNLKESAIDIIKDMSGKEALFVLLKALGAADASVKMAAIDALMVRKKKYVVPSLIYLLDDKNVIVRDRTAEVLKSMVDKSDLDTLLAFFRRAVTDEARETVAEFLQSILSDRDPSALEKMLHKDSFSLLLDILQKQGYSLGKYTTSVLGDKFATEEAYNEILKTLYSDSDEARAEALNALGKIGNPMALSHILKVLDDKTWYIRRNALEALKSFKSPKTITFAQKLMDDENAGVRLSAVEFLVMMNMRYKQQAVMWAVAEDTVKVLRKIPQLMARFKDQELANVYVDKMDATEPVVRMHAARKLLEMWDGINFKALTVLNDHSNWRIRLFAFMVLCDRDPESARALIERFRGDASAEIRKQLPELLLEIYKGESRADIQDMALNDSDLYVRKNAVKLLPSFELDDDLKKFIHNLLEKEESNTGLMEIGFVIDSLNYDLPKEVYFSLENKFPNEFKQLLNKISARKEKEQ